MRLMKGSIANVLVSLYHFFPTLTFTSLYNAEVLSAR